MPHVEVDDVSLWFTDSGDLPDSSTVPVLLVHGWTCDSHDWCFQLEDFESLHRVIAVDLRGHGRSTRPAQDYTVQRHAADLASLLNVLDVDKVLAIGHSLGASVVAALAVEYPNLVVATVSVEPAYGQDEAHVAWLREAALQFGNEAGNTLAAHLLGETEPLAPTWLRAWHRRRALGMDPALLKQTFWDMYFSEGQFSGQPQTDDYLSRRMCPTLAFHRLPAMAAWEGKIMVHTDSRVVSWEGAGHWLHQQHPEEFNALVLGWMREVTGRAVGDLGAGTAAANPAAQKAVA